MSYIFFALRNNYYYLVRQKCRYNAEISLNKPIGENIELGDEIVSQTNIEEEFLMNESLRYVKALLKNLSYEERELIEFIYIKNNSLKDFSRIKGISYTSCAKRKERILKKLRKMLLNEE